MKEYKGYLIDLDGTMYRGTELIAEACDFINKLKEKRIPYLFVTNNSTKKPDKVAEKLEAFGIPATEEQVFTSSLATANYLYERKANGSVYMIGAEGLRHALLEKGFTIQDEDTDFVVVGMDLEITYEKLAKACLNVRNGAFFVSTNGDIALPTERGLMPGNGSLTSVITVSTGADPVFIGKPESIIMEQALKIIGTSKEETIMIGDNYDSDILAGMNAGLDTLLVHTGVTTRRLLEGYKEKPTYTVDSLKEWMDRI